MSDTLEKDVPDVPNVWLVYNDHRKNTDAAGHFGQIKEMFSGYIDYDAVVWQARKMFDGRYKEGDFIVVVGDPRLVAIVVTVAEKYYAENGKLKLLIWDKDLIEYFPMEVNFPDDDDYTAAEVQYKSQRI